MKRLLLAVLLAGSAFSQVPALGSGGGGGGGGTGAPTDATYITQTANGSLSAEQSLGALATGCLGSATTTGVVSSRTITGTANKITVTNGDCTGNPTLTIPTGVVLVTPDIGVATGTSLALTGGIATGGATNSCDGTGGCNQFGQGTAPSGLATTGIQIIAPTSVTSWRATLPGTVGVSGFFKAAVSGTTATYTNAAIAAGDLPAVALTAGTSITLSNNQRFFECTSTCTITMPVPSAGVQYCVRNANNVTTVITFAAIGSSAMYEVTAKTSYGTAGTGTLVSGGTALDQMCLVGKDSTHYDIWSYGGTWTAN